MAQRDCLEVVQRTAAKLEVSEYYDMRASELSALGQYAMEKPHEAVSLAFRYGYAKGGRAAKAGRYSESRA